MGQHLKHKETDSNKDRILGIRMKDIALKRDQSQLMNGKNYNSFSNLNLYK